MRKIAIFILIVMAFSVAGFQEYKHILSEDGTSQISQITELAIFGTFDPSIPTKMANSCSKINDPGVSCKVEGNILVLKSDFSKNNKYFTIKTEYGFPEVTYTLTINKIPNDKFQKALLIASGEKGAVSDAIDFNDKSVNANLAKQMALFGLEINYTIGIPGEIVTANAGKYNAVVGEKEVTFQLNEVYKESAPLVVKAKTTNWSSVTMAGGVVFILLIALWFFVIRRKK